MDQVIMCNFPTKADLEKAAGKWQKINKRR